MSVPSNTPLPGQPRYIPPLVSLQLLVWTGMLTSAFAVPLEQISGTPSPTVTRAMIPEFAPLVHPGCGRLHTVGELVSATSVVLKSDPPLESMRPTPQPVCVTLV